MSCRATHDHWSYKPAWAAIRRVSLHFARSVPNHSVSLPQYGMICLLAGTQNRLILGAKRGFSKSALGGDVNLPLGTRQPSEATAAESRGCLASKGEDTAEQANAMPEIVENASIPRKRRISTLINNLPASPAPRAYRTNGYAARHAAALIVAIAHCGTTGAVRVHLGYRTAGQPTGELTVPSLPSQPLMRGTPSTPDTTTHNRAGNAQVTRCPSTDEENPWSGYVGIRLMIRDTRQPRDGPMKCGTQPADMSVIIIVAQSCSRIA